MRRWAAVGCGVSAVFVMTFCVLIAMAGYPSYRVQTHYVSELASSSNPNRHAFAAGLILGGAMITAFVRLVAVWLPRNRDARWGVGLATVSGVSMVLVGLFPLAYIVPHFLCAFVLFATAILAELYLAKAMLAMGRSGGAMMRAGARALFGLFVFHVVATVFGFGFSAYVTRDMRMDSLEQMLTDTAGYQSVDLAGMRMNPVALLEWAFLLTTMGAVVIATVATATGTEASEPRSPEGP